MEGDLNRILLVGDRISDLQPLAQACNDAEFPAMVAPGYDCAFEKLHAYNYELLVFDLDLKRKPTVELIHTIDEKLPYTPLVLLSKNYQQSQDLIFGLFELDIKGTWHILEKPFTLEVFSQLLRDVLERHEKTTAELERKAKESADSGKERRSVRQHKFFPIRFSFEQQKQESRCKTVTRGFLTNVSDGGIGLLTNRKLTADQYVSFENSLLCGTGRVVWCSQLDEATFKVGIRFC